MTTSARKAFDPFEKLISDHKRIAASIGRIERLSDRAEKERDKLFADLRDDLRLHMSLEEWAVYPILQRLKLVRTLTCEAYEEHHVAKVLLKELGMRGLDIEVWNAKLTVLRENIEHHVEEEERDLFPKARKAMKADEIEAMSVDMADFLVRHAGLPA